MRRQLRTILVFVMLALLALIIWKTEFLSTYIVEPIVRILWLFIRLFLSISQKSYWLLLILAILVLIIRILPESTEHSNNSAYKSSYKNNDRVRYWETLIKAAEGDKLDRLRLQRSLQTLSQSMEDISSGYDKVMIVLPPHKRCYLEWVRNAIGCLPLFQHILRKKVHTDSELEMYIDQILKSMENRMESAND